jgi:hypothetical protein
MLKQKPRRLRTKCCHPLNLSFDVTCSGNKCAYYDGKNNDCILGYRTYRTLRKQNID